jgi:aromatic ring-opening dioxygenase LigB subunit
MKTSAALLVLSSLFFGSTAIAGNGHDHSHDHSHDHPQGYVQTPVTQDVAEKTADKIFVSLIAREKVDKIWTAIKASTVAQKEVNGKAEWEVIYINKKVTNKEKQKLYIYLTLDGNYIAANFTGK